MLVTGGGSAVKRKCTDGDSFRMRLLAAACAVNVLHIAAVADTYYWLPERGVKADASKLSNWSIEFDSEAKAPVADAHPTRMPTASDELCAARDFHFDFNGESLAFKSMNAAAISPYTGSTYWGEYGEGWTFENGSLSVENLTQRISCATIPCRSRRTALRLRRHPSSRALAMFCSMMEPFWTFREFTTRGDRTISSCVRIGCLGPTVRWR